MNPPDKKKQKMNTSEERVLQSLKDLSEQDKYKKLMFHLTYMGRYEVIKKEAEKDPSIIHWTDKFGRSMLHWATLSKNLHLVQFLVENGVSVDCTDHASATPLLLAARCGSVEIAKYLIEKDVKCTTNSVTLYQAFRSSEAEWLIGINPLFCPCNNFCENVKMDLAFPHGADYVTQTQRRK